MHLKRLEIQGFKTFASKTIFEFRPGITAIVGPNGSGKCLVGTSLVTLADGRELPIRDLVESALACASTVEVLDDGWVTRSNPEQLRILSLNPQTLTLEPRLIAGFVKREAPEYLLRIQTRSGRTITATPYHPLFTLDQGQLRALRADEIGQGTHVALARRLPVTCTPVPLDPSSVATLFDVADGLYVPNTPALQAWATAGRERMGSATAWRQQALVPKVYLEYTTASEQMARQVMGILLRLKVFSRLNLCWRQATNSPTQQRRPYWSVMVYGGTQLRYLATHLQFVGKKAEALEILRNLTTKDNPNLDLVPGVTPLVRQAVQLAGFSLKRHRAGRAKLCAYAEQRCEASRNGLIEVVDQITALGQTPNQAEAVLQQLRLLAQSDVYWDEVVAVEQVLPPDPWVYDLSIAETHNFVAEHFVVHNSNLADAVRWVLGEQSLTHLRCKRSEELIYAGGGRRAPAGFAEVSLTIDNSDRLLPLDFDEVTLTRRATRSGESEYLINRAKVRLRDLLEATEPLGGSYTIINQGLVDAALTLRPEERRRLFEDAAELGGFEARKAEALRRLRETDANLSRLSDLLAELEPRLRVLKRQAAQARQHRELSDELQQLQIQYYAQRWRSATALAATTAQTLAQAEQALAQARQQQLQVVAELQTLRATVRTRREALSQLHQEASTLHRRAEATQRELAVAGERAAALSRRNEDLARQRNELALRRQQAEAQQAEAQQAIQVAADQLATCRHALAQAEAARAADEQARHSLAAELRQAQDAALQAARSHTETRSRLEQLAAQQERLTYEANELAAAVDLAEQQRIAAQEQVQQARAVLQTALQAREAAANHEQTIRYSFEALRHARNQADELRTSARRNLADLEARLDTLNRLARSYAGTFAGVRAAMQWAERTGRSGFVLVQTLIRTPPELETAIEVALGSRLQQIVVDHWADAEAAIDELKRSGVGRATFLPLDTLRAPRDEGRYSRAGSGANDSVLGVAADLVAYDPPYALVARQLLGRVLIVRDLPTARNELRTIGSGWTIVTLGGEQLNSGGAVTGGAQTKESGALRRERALRELPDQVAHARTAVTTAEQQYTNLETQIQTQASQLREAETALRAAQRHLEQARANLETAERRQHQMTQEHNWVSQRSTALATQQTELANQWQTAQQDLIEAEAAVQTAEATLAALRSRQEAQAQADQAAQQQLADLRTAVAAAEGRLRTEQHLQAAHHQSLTLITRQYDELEQALAQAATEQAVLAAAQAQAEALHTSLLATIDTLRAQLDPAEAELQADETRLNELEAEEAAATKALLAAEATQNQAALEAQRARDRQEALFERAAADGIDLSDQANLTTATEPPLETLQPALAILKTRILRLGVVNPLSLEEYEATAERQRFLSSQIEDLREAGATLNELIGELDEAMHSRFAATFRAVAAEFSQTFRQLFGGGSAELVLSGSASEEVGEGSGGKTQGVEIIARPPGKKQQNIALLSGGERTLTAVALLFAILRVNPSPFCILDETDAALDESNVGRFREALNELTNQTQFIVITHNRGTIEAADTLYGVTMADDGASRTVSLRVEEYVMHPYVGT